MRLSEEDVSKVLVNDLPEQSDYHYIIYAAQRTGRLADVNFVESQEANSEAWSGVMILMAGCIARGMRLAKER